VYTPLKLEGNVPGYKRAQANRRQPEKVP
jgi:hypothetical protein